MSPADSAPSSAPVSVPQKLEGVGGLESRCVVLPVLEFSHEPPVGLAVRHKNMVASNWQYSSPKILGLRSETEPQRPYPSKWPKLTASHGRGSVFAVSSAGFHSARLAAGPRRNPKNRELTTSVRCDRWLFPDGGYCSFASGFLRFM